MSSPARTPFLSAVKVPLNAGAVDPTDDMLPLAFADPPPENTSPVLNAPG